MLANSEIALALLPLPAIMLCQILYSRFYKMLRHLPKSQLLRPFSVEPSVFYRFNYIHIF